MRVHIRNPDRDVEVAGPKRVREVLAELAIDPETVLVIRERTLVTREERLADEDRIEIRPVISGGSSMKCKRCGGGAVVEVRRHNAGFCRGCFEHHVREQVKRAITSFRMLLPEDRVLVAVSGGKDSLGLWDVLLDLGYEAAGLYLGLGIDDYSDAWGEKVRAFVTDRGARLVEVDLRRDFGYDIPTAGRKGARSTCAVCGLSKRYVFNRAALWGGFDVVATGHNLDDEAANLLGNTLRWQTEAFLRGIDYQVEECPLVAGNTQLRYKLAPNRLESSSPGTKAQFFLGYLDRAAALFRGVDEASARLTSCERCGQPTPGRFCAFCRARAQVLGEPLSPPASGGVTEDPQVALELSEEVLPAEMYGGPG